MSKAKSFDETMDAMGRVLCLREGDVLTVPVPSDWTPQQITAYGESLASVLAEAHGFKGLAVLPVPASAPMVVIRKDLWTNGPA